MATFNYSDRFVKQEQWESWKAKRKLVSGSLQAPGAFSGANGITSGKFLRLQSGTFWPENA